MPYAFDLLKQGRKKELWQRCCGFIDLTIEEFAGDVLVFPRAFFTEKTIWQAIENSGLNYVDWVARKEVQETPVLHLYVEIKGQLSEAEVYATIDKQLKKANKDHAELVDEIGLHILKVTRLPSGAFAEYLSRQRAAGAELAHLKPPHINPSDSIMAMLAGESYPVLTASR